MQMNEEMQIQGKWLFRWRSYLPLLFFMLFIPSFLSFHYPFGSHLCDLIWEICCLGIGLSGLVVRCLVVGYAPRNTSGRNTKEQIADVLNTTGMYSLVRNPLYLGNFLMWFAPVLFLHDAWLCIVYVLAFTLYYERIIVTEEAFLSRKFGRQYTDWASRTPAFFPRHFRWESPQMSFSWKTIIRREYHGFYGLIAAMTAMEHIGEIAIRKTFTIDETWAWIFIFGTAVYLSVRFLAKCTKILDVEGR